MSQFKLSATLAGHESDVRAVVAPFNDTIVSASRDRTVRVWTKEGMWSGRVNFTSAGYVNSLAFDPVNTTIISGGQDQLINVTDVYSSSASPDPKYVLIGHESNVCALDCSGTEIISGSWDTTAKVWENNVLKYSLEGHSASVWDVKILGQDRYLTCSADKTVKIWEKNKEVKSFIGHTDVVRALTLLPGGVGFASASNDGTVRLTTFEGELIEELVGHESFVYSLDILDNGDVVTAGEDRTVRIWRDGIAIQVITLPCVSVWSVAVQPNGDIVSGSSDGMVRIFTRAPERFASEDEIADFNHAVESMALNSQAFDESKAAPPEALDSPGEKEGQVIVVKSNTGIHEAYQWTEARWVKVGEVVSGATSDQKQEFDGKMWDFVFDVDVQEGAPPLKLPYNASENPYVAAQRFLEMNELPLTFTDQIVDFIAKNTQGVAIGQVSDNVDPYADKRRSKLVPHNDYLGFTSNNFQSIMKGIRKFNETEKTYDDVQLASMEVAFEENDYAHLLTVSATIIESWDNKLPGFDIFRLVVTHLDDPPQFLIALFDKGLIPSQPTLFFMTLRCVSNIFLNKKWGEQILTDLGITMRIMNILDLTGDAGKHSVNIANALATVLLNYSVYASRFKSVKIAELIANVLRSKGSSIGLASSEAAYRIAVAYGNLVYIDRSLKDDYQHFHKRLTYNEERFKDITEDIEGL